MQINEEIWSHTGIKYTYLITTIACVALDTCILKLLNQHGHRYTVAVPWEGPPQEHESRNYMMCVQVILASIKSVSLRMTESLF